MAASSHDEDSLENSHISTPTDSHESAADDSHEEVIDENDPLYQIQKYADYKYAAISILFSVEEHDEVNEEV